MDHYPAIRVLNLFKIVVFKMRRISIILQILLCAFPPIATATLDWSNRTLVRSYPTGGYTEGWIGKGFKFWESKKRPQLLYGFARPTIGFKTSGVINIGSVQLDLNPISFIKLYTGYSKVIRSLDKLDTFDCDIVICRTKLTRTYYGSKVGLKFKEYFLMADFRLISNKIESKVGDFADERSALIGRSGKDILSRKALFIGKQLNDKWSSGILVLKNKMKYNVNSSQLTVAVGQYKKNKWTYSLALGNFNTRFDQNVMSILAFFKWQGNKGLLLF